MDDLMAVLMVGLMALKMDSNKAGMKVTMKVGESGNM
jgi:hypothetical protein